jgi:coenzyme F420-dependent glucose-6-phosphate dehydrogenase
MEIGYWLSSEEHGPKDLVRFAVEAEATGIGSAVISDHFHPWVRAQGESPFVWSVLGAIAQATRSLRVGTGVTAPIIRTHPVVVAHAAATVAVQMDGRFFLGLGTGERLSEHVTGQRWPGATERREMLEDAVDVIKQLFAGGNVNHHGPHYRVENAQQFTLPRTAPEIVLAVSGAKSAALAGRVGDGMLAVAPNPKLAEAFEAAGGAGKRRLGQLHVCWADSVDKARRCAAELWPNAALKGAALADLARPKDFEAVLAPLPEPALTDGVICGPDPELYVEAIARFAAAGYTEVYVHQIGPDQQEFLRFEAEHVRPRLR